MNYDIFSSTTADQILASALGDMAWQTTDGHDRLVPSMPSSFHGFMLQWSTSPDSTSREGRALNPMPPDSGVSCWLLGWEFEEAYN
jgi:hypothetical protein